MTTSILMIFLAIVQAVCRMGNSWLAVLFSEGVGHRLRTGTFSRVQTLRRATSTGSAPGTCSPG